MLKINQLLSLRRRPNPLQCQIQQTKSVQVINVQNIEECKIKREVENYVRNGISKTRISIIMVLIRNRTQVLMEDTIIAEIPIWRRQFGVIQKIQVKDGTGAILQEHLQQLLKNAQEKNVLIIEVVKIVLMVGSCVKNGMNKPHINIPTLQRRNRTRDWTDIIIAEILMVKRLFGVILPIKRQDGHIVVQEKSHQQLRQQPHHQHQLKQLPLNHKL